MCFSVFVLVVYIAVLSLFNSAAGSFKKRCRNRRCTGVPFLEGSDANLLFRY